MKVRVAGSGRRRVPRALRRAVAACLCAAALGAGSAQAQTQAQTPPSASGSASPFAVGPVRAPHYGDTLFLFYQDRFFEAVTGLMASQQLGRLAPHDDEAEVLRGGLLLSWGLHAQAGEVFERLIERQAPPAVRDRAWFFLARMRHQRGLHADAQAALDRVGDALPVALDDERRLLQAQLLMARGEHAAAMPVLEALTSRDPASVAPWLARFNLAVALLRAGGPDAEAAQARATALLEAVGQAPGANEEIRALRDRANLALGFAALQAKKPREARVALQRVRLGGLQANPALLAYGWAAAELNDPQLALVPWTELAARPLSDASVLEAQIAVPYAMAEIGAYTEALARYRAAAAAFEGERRALGESIAAVREGRLAQDLLARHPEPSLDGFARLSTLPPMPHAGHLLPLLADHPFQTQFRHLRDLRFLVGNLAQAQQNLAVFTDMLDNRRQAFATRLPAVRAAAGAVDLPALAARRDALAAELAAAEARQDGTAFADTTERALQARLARAQATLQAAVDAPSLLPASELAEAAERLRRVQGALAWRLAQAEPERAWAARKALRDTARGLETARELDAALLRAQADEPARHEAFAARIAALGARIAALAPQVAALDGEVQAAMARHATEVLQAQQERLDTYTAQARLAIAQIIDRATLVGESGRERARGAAGGAAEGAGRIAVPGAPGAPGGPPTGGRP